MNSAVTRSVTNDDVYIGFWTNWSLGRTRGATLTLRTRDAGFLSAFLALFVAVAGTSFWRIACFALHHALSSPRVPRDAIYHQRQAILRNAATATTGLMSFALLSWAWRPRKRTQSLTAAAATAAAAATTQPATEATATVAEESGVHSLRRTLPLLAFATATLAAFAAAGLFTARVATSMGDAVLLTGRNCGWRNDTDFGAYISRAAAYGIQRFGSSGDYAQRCYPDSNGSTEALSQACPTFPRRRLAWRSVADAPCPFPGQGRVCKFAGGASAAAPGSGSGSGSAGSTSLSPGNLRLESGFIDSNADLGINLPPRDGFRFRNVVECAPLKTEGFVRRVTSGALRNHTRAVYMYGASPYMRSLPDAGNATYHYSADPVTWFNSSSLDNTNRQYTLEYV
jgi:hypothetical protein